jgi:hypothetical protein
MNMEHARMIDTPEATVQRVSEDLLEVRYKPDVRMSLEGIGKVVTAKRELVELGHPDVLVVVPPEIEVDLKVVTADHHLLFGDCRNTGRLAFVAQSQMNLKLAEIHYKYHPRANGTAVFRYEGEAREWLANAQPFHAS